MFSFFFQSLLQGTRLSSGYREGAYIPPERVNARVRLAVAPIALPVSLAEAKTHLHVDHPDEDALITAMIRAAAERCEHITGVALMPQTWELAMDCWPSVAVDLGITPVNAVESVSYVDSNGTRQTLNPAFFTLDNYSRPGQLLPLMNTVWPATSPAANAVVVRFTAGYATAADIPSSIKDWILMHVGGLYRNREAFSSGVSVAELPNRFVDSLLDRHRVWVL